MIDTIRGTRGVHLIMVSVSAVLVALLWGGCTGQGDRIEVEVCGAQLEVPAQVDAVRVSVLDRARQELRAGTRELVLCPQDKLLSLPQVVAFDSLDEEDAWVVVQGLKDGVEVLRYERRASLSTGVIEQVNMVLAADCLGVQCPLGQTCVEGACEIVSVQGLDPSLCQRITPSSEDMTPTMMEQMNDMGQVEEEEEEGEVGPTYCPAPSAPDEDDAEGTQEG